MSSSLVRRFVIQGREQSASVRLWGADLNDSDSCLKDNESTTTVFRVSELISE